ncbi:MAG: hypothetical protein Aurels2KO_14520 [Aureliella sp.]
MKKTTQPTTSLAASLAPEDVKIGDFIAPLTRTYELPSYLWNDAYTTHVVRLQMTAHDAGCPMKVKAVCLPFVHVSLGKKKRQIIDVRTTQIARVDERYARQVRRDIAKKRL